jgi:hypothetical protein
VCVLTGLVLSAFFLAYWLVFCSPKDIWFKSLKQGAILVPLKAFETIRYGVLISTLGMDKALVAEHPKMRQSVCLQSVYRMSAASKACQQLVKRVRSLSISRSLALYLSLARSLCSLSEHPRMRHSHESIHVPVSTLHHASHITCAVVGAHARVRAASSFS